MIRFPHPDTRQRHGVILLVVITLLTLFSVLGIAFVMYANTTAEGARLGRESQTEIRPDVEPELLFSYFLGQLLYDCPDDATGVYSALRGHSLARSMYGLNYELPDLANPNIIAARNSTPYHGTGRLRTLPSDIPGGPEDYYTINYTYFPGDGLLRDPERPGARSGGGDPLTRSRKPYIGGYNAPYTYPDLNNMYLAAMKADGTLMLPSFYRPWQGDNFFGPLNSSNANWLSTVGKYKILRPRPVDHLTQADVVQAGLPWPLVVENLDNAQLTTLQTLMQRLLAAGKLFPYPADATGDVKNLIGYSGGNDSIWLDLDAPIMTAPDGRKYKPLFAPLVLDLDNRVNLNVHGNARAVYRPDVRTAYRVHASNQGWGPWEVNPGHLGGLIDPTSGGGPTPLQREWANVFTGTTAPNQRGRMGPLGPPYGNSPPGSFGRVYSPADLDGANETNATPSDAARLPGTPPSQPWQAFPSVPPGYGNGNASEMNAHPALVNPFGGNNPDHYIFPLSNIEALLRYGDTGSPALTSEIFRLAPLNFDPRDPEFLRRRNLVTMLSADIDRPGVTPFFWARQPGGETYTRVPTPPKPSAPVGTQVPFHLPEPPYTDLPSLLHSEFGPDWRTRLDLTQLRRLDLNRYLPKYPAPDPTSGMIPASRLDDVKVAIRARQHMAAEIFELLCKVTGAGEPRWILFPPLQKNRWEAFRWLAQLAVNIVDFIDEDECITPFQWDSLRNEWVFGTELPRLVLNEVYVEYDNHTRPGGILPPTPEFPRGRADRTYMMSVWVELHNPLAPDVSLSDGGSAVLQHVFPHYQIVVTGHDSRLREPGNVKGDPRNPRQWVIDQFGPLGTRVEVLPLPIPGQFAGPVGQNVGFFVIGPNLNAEAAEQPLLLPDAVAPNLPVSATNQRLLIEMPAVGGLQKPTILLRRLACPHLRPNSPDVSNPPFDPAQPLNPYVTIDYVEDVWANDGRILDRRGEIPGGPPAMHLRHSMGRSQPFAAALPKAQDPKAGIPVASNMPRNSFFQHNVDSTIPGPNWPGQRFVPSASAYPPFDWLPHLDRPLISPMELVHVSAYKPHELTQQFITSDEPPVKYQHRAPWFDESPDLEPNQSHRLYRVFEFLTTGHRSAGMRTAYAPGFQPLIGITSIPRPGTHRVRLNAYAGPTGSGGTWEIGPGSTLIIDQGRRDSQGNLIEEVVRVDASRQADFLRPHDVGYTITPVTLSDRIPGKINMNTIWDIETFMALCDPQPANGLGFDFNAVSEIFRNLVKERTPDLLDNPNGGPSERDRPFLGMAVGNYADSRALFRHENAGINDTYFCSVDRIGTHRDERLMHPPSEPHHYFQNQLLHKIYNHLTTRSNVFAVWVTVGFFEVMDDQSRPVKLGAELKLADGSSQRHRMFAVVDRSVMTANPGPQRQFRLGNNPANAWTTGLVVPYYSIIQ